MSCNNCCYSRVYIAIDNGCVPCFKVCLRMGRNSGWDKNTMLTCVKRNQPDMLKYALEMANEPNVPPEIRADVPTAYEVATHATQHNNTAWYPYILNTVGTSSNVRRIALFKLAIKSGDQNLCSQIYPYLKPRTTESATNKDMTDFMECAVFSRRLGMIMWVEQKYNTHHEMWPSQWRNNGRRLIEMIFKNKKYYTRLSMFMETFRHVFERINVHCWDEVAKHILNYNNPDNANTWSLFNHFWFNGGRESARPSWKNYCIRYNKLEELQLIHESCPEWPADFASLCELTPGVRQWSRRNLKEWAEWHGLDARNIRGENERILERQANAVPVEKENEKTTNLQKALAVIEDCDIPEGKYLELCNLLMDVHRRGVV